MVRCPLLIALLLAMTGTAATAASSRVMVRGADGRPVAEAVVFVDVPGVAPPSPRGPYVMEQRDISFEPHLVIVPVGASVTFPNRDKVRHHVYSFSQPKRFNLKLYGREEARSVLFDRPGVVALGCNIHDQMAAFVVVTSTPFAARTDGSGVAMLPNIPAGRATMRVWFPAIRQPGNMLSRPVSVPANGLDEQVVLRP
jgi:plastocyanin